MAAVSVLSSLYYLLYRKLGETEAVLGSGLGYPMIRAGSIFRLLSDVPDVVLSILHGLPHLILAMTW